MNWIHTIFVLAVAFVAVFIESAFQGTRPWLGAQVDLLPSLMVYASLCTELPTVALLGMGGGLLFDSLSANPLGVSCLPLLLIGLAIHAHRDLILRDQPFAQLALGLGASAAAPALTLLILLTTGHPPLLGWGLLWQWMVMAIGGALATPVWFWILARLQHALLHEASSESSFRADREIRRGRL